MSSMGFFTIIIGVFFISTNLVVSVSSIQLSNRDGRYYQHRQERPTKRSAHPLTAEIINSSTLVLKGLPQAGDFESCPVSGYMVRVKQEGLKRAHVRKVDGVRQTITLQSLTPNKMYHIKLITITCKGKSKPSRWIAVKTPEYSVSGPEHPRQPQMVVARPYSDSIFVSWQPPEGNAPITGYVVGYGEGVPDVNWQYIEGHRRNVTIRNLKRGTQYVISVRAYNKEGKGPVVYELVFTNENSVPSVPPPPPPINLKSTVLSSNTVALTWSDPSLPTSHLKSSIQDNRYYVVHYQSTNPLNGQLVERSEHSKKLHVTISGLTPATRYEFKVRTIKDGQTGQFSSTISNRTSEIPPGSPPRSLTVTLQSIDEQLGLADALVHWRPPRLPNGNITDYMVQYTDNVELPSDNWQSITVRQKTEAIVHNLQVANSYFFRVQAKNSIGYGPKSDITKINVVFKNPDAYAHKPEINRNNEVDKTVANNNRISEIVVNNNNINNNQSNETEENTIDYDEDDDLLKEEDMDELPSNKRKREQNLSSESSEDLNTVRPEQINVEFKVLLQVKVSAFITWPQHPPTSDCQSKVRPKSFKLRYRREDSNGNVWHWSTRSMLENMAVLEDLMLNAKYAYQVKYLTDVESAWSAPHYISTYPKQDG